MSSRYLALFKKIAYTFKHEQSLTLALTHRSYASKNNERLEFLGDGVLNFVIAHQLFERFPNIPEGDLSRLRAQLVKEATLADIAFALDLGDLLKMGEGELKSAGWRRPSILSDAVEAIIGAIYLEGGFDAAQATVLHLFDEKLNTINPSVIEKDAKSTLQEYLQGRKIDLPEYTVAAIEGEAHAQHFTVNCTIKKLDITTTGEGHSRRVAEQLAAKLALEKINP